MPKLIVISSTERFIDKEGQPTNFYVLSANSQLGAKEQGRVLEITLERPEKEGRERYIPDILRFPMENVLFYRGSSYPPEEGRLGYETLTIFLKE